MEFDALMLSRIQFGFTVAFRMPNDVTTLPVVKPTVQLSWDDGKTWQSTRTSCAGSSCDVEVTNLHGRKASLRVSASDTAGRTVSQEVIRAYSVR